MDDFLSNLGSVSWWLSVVIVGILINMFSAVLSRKVDDRLSKASSWWRSKSEKRKAKRQELLQVLEPPHERILLSLEVFHFRFEALLAFAAGVGIMFVTKSIAKQVDITHASKPKLIALLILIGASFLVSAFTFIIGILYLFTAVRKRGLLRDAHKTKLWD